ncbi:hypothetical protein CYY_008921 [Polysphondylium violaceum]|uniref:FNIP repeat-containing protein n=1 Tax=Polysphondylium violaceum TaxID=133409 RepID=A0A8J4PMM4_9MYCE|nr:hypothetical protein CYY_008921 [Polysphondylium violaceum]
MTEESFYLIWRNQYTRRLLRNLVCKEYIINVKNNEYMIENHQYLSLFTNRDKLDYNISIRFRGFYSDYVVIDKRNRYLIDDVDIIVESDDVINLNEIHEGVHKLSFFISPETTSATGKLPSSISYLRLCNQSYGDQPPYAQQILSNLPANLQELVLGIQQYSITSPCIMPESLTDIKSDDTDTPLNYENLKWFVVPAIKVYQSCIVYIDSMESFEWLLVNKWICSVQIDSNVLNMNQLPSHVTHVVVNDDIVQDTSSFPQTLESLFCCSGTPIPHFAHLKVLNIDGVHELKLEKGVLPASLQDLSLDYYHPLEVGVLPPHLTSLKLHYYNQPLCPNVLPPHLTTLHLPSYDQPLCPNDLPSSVTDLKLTSFNRPLDAYVLPQKLKRLHLYKFSQPVFPSHSLPVSLTHLIINGYNVSFDQCQPLDNLKKLEIETLDPSLAILLANVEKIHLLIDNREVSDPSSIAFLHNTSIRRLVLDFFSKITLYPNTFPPTLRHLTLANAKLESGDVIPSGCVYLTKEMQENWEYRYR